MPATRRTRAQTAKASTAVSLDTILLATAVGAGAAAYFFFDVAPEVVVASCVAAVVVVLIYGGKVQKYVRGRKPKAAKPKAAKAKAAKLPVGPAPRTHAVRSDAARCIKNPATESLPRDGLKLWLAGLVISRCPAGRG